MSLLEKFVDSLDVRVGNSHFLEVLKPFRFNGSLERNVVIQINKGEMYSGTDEKMMPENSFYFIPEDQDCYIRIGKDEGININKDLLAIQQERSEFFRKISGLESWDKKNQIITILSLDVVLYNAFPFFPLLQMPPFELPFDEEFAFLLKHICLENEQNKLGKNIIVKNYMQELVIHLYRYIESQPQLAAYTEKLNYLTDKRLIDMVRYIQENLDKDLSNKAIAQVAFVSEEYVGQLFKTLTGRTLQDYIEDQRLEKAFQLLKSHPDNVQEISQKVGFKDPAYFSKRFKSKFGINANAVKQGKSQVI